jgi:hypothetical protein
MKTENNSTDALKMLTDQIASISNTGNSDENKNTHTDSDTGSEKIHTVPPEDYIWTEEDEDPEAEQDGSEPEKETITAADLIDPETAVAFMNFLIPMGIVLILRVAGYKSKRKDFELTASERKIIERPLGLALKATKINFNNPFMFLGITVGCVYGAKIFDKFDTFEKMPPKKRNNERNRANTTDMPDVDDNIVDGNPKAKEKVKKKKTTEEPIDIKL